MKYKIENLLNTDMILLALNDGEIKGLTKMQKIIFLMFEEGKFKDIPNNYSYHYGRMGQTSIRIYDSLITLEAMNLINIIKIENEHNISEDILEESIIYNQFINRTQDVTISLGNCTFSLTNKGKIISDKLFESLSRKHKKYLKKVIFGNYLTNSLFEILHYTYTKYPSKIQNIQVS